MLGNCWFSISIILALFWLFWYYSLIDLEYSWFFPCSSLALWCVIWCFNALTAQWILEAADSVHPCITGRPVVPCRVSASLYLHPKSSLLVLESLMSRLEREVFPVPVSRNDLLHLLYDRDVARLEVKTSITVVFAKPLPWRHSCSLYSTILSGTQLVARFNVFTARRPIVNSCICETVSANIMPQMSLKVPNDGFTGTVKALVFVVALARRRTFRSYAVDRKGN